MQGLNNSLVTGADSDDYDYEDDSDESSSQQSGLGQPIRRFLNFRKGRSNRSAGIVRITSSDPRSSLSSAPIQLDMDSMTSVAPSEVIQDPVMASVMQHSASVARRRRESGRLLASVGSGSPSSRTSSPLGRASPLRKAGSLNHHPSSPPRPPRPPRSQLQRLGLDHTSDTDANAEQVVSGRDGIVPSSSSQTFTSAGAEFEEEEEAAKVPPSILVRQPQVYARKVKLESSTPSHEMYSMNGNASGSAVWQNSPGESGSDFSYSLHVPPPTSVGTRRLPPGAGHAPTSPLHSPLHKLGSMDPSQIQAYWLERKSKSIRLQEPDWTPYIDVHIRAKERLETAAHVAANPQSTLAMSSHLLPPRTLGDTSDGSERGSHQSGHHQSDPDEEFWFERFTQSTAAAGRDWDWRKRRRQRQAAAAAKADEEALRTLDGSAEEDIVNAGNVGMTDVQLQRQRNEHARKTNQFAEGPSRPILSVSTSDSTLMRRSSASPSGKQASPSPFGKRLKRYASPMADSSIEPPAEEDLGSTMSGIKVVKNKTSTLGRKKPSRRYSEPDNEEADVSVPNRLSSLKPKMMRRGIGKRERDADLTKQLLAEAEEVATDEEDDGKEMARKQTEMMASASPRGALGVKRSASASNLGFSSQEPPVLSTPILLDQDDLWGASAGGWSSADAYGSASPSEHPQSLHISVHPSNLTPASSPPILANTTSAYLLAGGEELRRQGSKADSQGSGSSTSPLPVFATARSGSRKGILSSASRAAALTSSDSSRHVSEGGSPMRLSDSNNSSPHNSLLPPALPVE